MRIEFTKDQYKNLIIINGISGWILGILSDAIEGNEYKEKCSKSEELENYLLGFAKDFGCETLTEEFDGKKYLTEKTTDKYIYPVIEDYVDYEIQDGLANELAKRDFRRDHTKEEIKRMAKENSGYFGAALYDYEKKYWDEFEMNGYERLEIKNNND